MPAHRARFFGSSLGPVWSCAALGRQTWRDATYESWGFSGRAASHARALATAARRDEPSSPHLVAVCALPLLDLLMARLRLNILSALLAW